MNKLKLLKVFNQDKENYFKIKVLDKESEDYIKTTIELLNKLNISSNLESEPQTNSCKYKDWIGCHEFKKGDKYKLHMIFEENNIHLIVKCSIKNREELMKVVKECFEF